MSAVAEVRSFTRFYTRVIGVLDEGLLDTEHTLPEARLIFELAQADAVEVPDLRRSLGLDAGYLSRLLGGLEARGLVARSRSEADTRRQVVRLTASGRRAFATLDARSASQVDGLLAPLGRGEVERLVDALSEARALLSGEAAGTGTPSSGEAAGTVTLRPAGAGDWGWIVARHGRLYADEYGWDETFEALVARIVADHVDSRDPARELTWIAEVGGRPAGCVMCVRDSDEVARLRLLLVEPSGRGAGVGTRLVDECLRFARAAGYREMVLWTNDVLVDARRLYERAGFTLEASGPHRSFGHDLVEQTWRRTL